MDKKILLLELLLGGSIALGGCHYKKESTAANTLSTVIPHVKAKVKKMYGNILMQGEVPGSFYISATIDRTPYHLEFTLPVEKKLMFKLQEGDSISFVPGMKEYKSDDISVFYTSLP